MLTIYTKEKCPNCDLAKAYLDRYGISYAPIDVDQTEGAREFLITAGLRSVPQLYFNETLIPGGYDGLTKLPVETLSTLKESVC